MENKTLKEFTELTAGKNPVPGGGSVSALCGSLAAALAENEALKSQIVTLQARQAEAEAAPAAPSSTAMELEAYRRAERTERIARERAELVYHQVNGVLADATVKVDEAHSRIDGLTQQVTAQLQQLQEAVSASRQALSDAAATLYTIRPTGEN